MRPTSPHWTTATSPEKPGRVRAPRGRVVRVGALIVAALATISLTGCGYTPETAEQQCRKLQLEYSFHNGEATLFAADDKLLKATEEMYRVVEIVLGNPSCFPEKLVQDVQYWYTTQPGIATTEEEARAAQRPILPTEDGSND